MIHENIILSDIGEHTSIEEFNYALKSMLDINKFDRFNFSTTHINSDTLVIIIEKIHKE